VAAPIAFPKQASFPREAELAARIYDLVHEYSGEISLVAALGVLEMTKSTLLQEA
jgi:hypothetical protein